FLSQRLVQAVNNAREENRNRLKVLAGRLEALSPLATLARGYSICTRPGTPGVIHNAREVGSGEKVQIKLHQGRLLCQVEESIAEEAQS
ncbi:MAG: exodeoxyribonuclease VII large subunit, partial [Bacillota bacterium]